jgi:hypothetical protein
MGLESGHRYRTGSKRRGKVPSGRCECSLSGTTAASIGGNREKGEKFFPVHAVRILLIACPFRNDTFYTYGFLVQDSDVMKLDAVTQVYALLSHG